jgi:hypothetical protein
MPFLSHQFSIVRASDRDEFTLGSRGHNLVHIYLCIYALTTTYGAVRILLCRCK